MNHESSKAPPPPAPVHPALTSPLLPIAVATVAVLVYANSLWNGFAYDDVFIVQQNARVHAAGDLRSIWLTPYWPNLGTLLGLYRPLTIWAFSLQWAIGGGAAWPFHATNVVLHALVSVLVFQLARRFTGPLAAAAGALVFAVHPLHTEAVANVVGQAELIAAATVLGALLVHLGRPGLEVSWPRRVLLVLLMLAGMLAKESAIVMPALLVLADFAQRRVTLARSRLAAYVRAMAVPAVLLGCAVAAYLLLRLEVLGSITGVDAAPAFPYLREQYRLLHAFRAWPEYVRLLFAPFDLAADYGPAVVLPVEGYTPMVVFGLALLLGTVTLTLLTPRYPGPGLVAGWFLVSILTISNLFFPVGVLIAERTLYLPSVAVALLVALLWDRLEAGAPAAARRRRILGMAALGAVLVVFAGRTVLRNPDWKDTVAVFRALLRDHPEAYRAQWMLALNLWARGDIARAEHHWLLAYRLWPRDAQFLTEYANFHFGQRNYGRAIELLETARAMHPDLARPYLLLGWAQLGAGRYADALRAMADAERLGATLPTPAARAEALHHLGRYDQAAAAWRLAIRRGERNSWLTWAQLARSLAAAGRSELALEAADSALLRADTIPIARPAAVRLRAAAASGCLAERTCADPLLGWSVALRSSPADSAISLHNATEVRGPGTPPGGIGER